VVAAIEAGHTRAKVAKLYNTALSTVGGIIKRKRKTVVSLQPNLAGTRLSRSQIVLTKDEGAYC
jgi:hypothetical protein